MRHSAPFRLLSALLGVLVLFNLSQPMAVSGMNMSGMDMNGVDMAAHCEAMAGDAQHASHSDPSHDASQKHHDNEQSSSAPSKGHEECVQHECCTSALVHASVLPSITLSWLPEYVISQQTPCSSDCVIATEGQVRLPFANGPPASVIV